ncbi:hypothetical protein FQA39_LY12829 [Lamprigera yunnana]|nr:hypothetical protein FQA39_LY12829 [Lamprigera yunnana]
MNAGQMVRMGTPEEVLKDKDFLRSIQLDIPFVGLRDKITCVIGNTGSGKSTLIQLTNGLLVSETGRTLVGDYPIPASIGKIKEVKQLHEIGIEPPKIFGQLMYKLKEKGINLLNQDIRNIEDFALAVKNYKAKNSKEDNKPNKRRHQIMRITFGRYIPRNSVIHRMDPRLKLGMIILLIVSIFFYNWIYRVPVYILSMIISIALRMIPTLIDEAGRIMKAQSSRGIDIKNDQEYNLLTQRFELDNYQFKNIDISKLQEICNLFVGEHDFKLFCGLTSKELEEVNTIRSIDSIILKKEEDATTALPTIESEEQAKSVGYKDTKYTGYDVKKLANDLYDNKQTNEFYGIVLNGIGNGEAVDPMDLSIANVRFLQGYGLTASVDFYKTISTYAVYDDSAMGI